ncbi:SPOR domain-containing protein [Olivibacter sp. SDN3]|uniref:SPOR domain-containing protein n=1 Tax=Olivibacter sp. SDN3 TaxID=2764720 RepID=UPI00165145AE|nr:SPOR domain-containing protein [Olivibacter sp. SDN3]QNL50646.1 SPOR domain-containing protein [Olivibacter sp. SDN3]
MNKYFLLTCFFCLSLLAVSAQDKKGILEEHKSTLIERLQQERTVFGNAETATGEGEGTRPGVPVKTGQKVTANGYRVQIYSGTNRSDAYAAQAKFKHIYKDLNTYLGYEQPNYRVKVGDFTNRSHAQALMNQLKKSFNSVFIFTETVNLEY